MCDAKIKIARRVARELKDGYVVNLGIGLPTLVGDYVPEGVSVLFNSENGILGMGPLSLAGEENPDLVNAGGRYVGICQGGCVYDSATSFAVIRGGHVDLTVLGALQVDEKGNLASHSVPGKMTSGMGGAMDLVSGARYVIVAMTHLAAKGEQRIVKELTYPVTALGRVNLIITEHAVIEVTDKGLLVLEIARGTSPEELRAMTGADLLIPSDVKEIPDLR